MRSEWVVWWHLGKLLSCQTNRSVLSFDSFFYHLSAHPQITTCLTTVTGGIETTSSVFVNELSRTSSIPVIVINIDLWPEIINIRFSCHLTPKALFIYYFIHFQSSGWPLWRPYSTDLLMVIKHETFDKGIKSHTIPFSMVVLIVASQSKLHKFIF